jgi:hypothetical protein
MSEKNLLTRRAYALRLEGVDKNERSWRDALWATRLVANEGAKAFGDWLLTLRGGAGARGIGSFPGRRLGRSRVDDARPLHGERRAQGAANLVGVVLLSVESELGAPREYVIASGEEKSEVVGPKVLAAFEDGRITTRVKSERRRVINR